MRSKKILALFLAVMVAAPFTGCATFEQRARQNNQGLDQAVKNDSAQRQNKTGADLAQQMFDQYVERMRWSRYWLGATHDGEIYVEGAQVSVLFFWTKTSHRIKRGFCSPALALCLANPSSPGQYQFVQKRIDSDLTPQLAFASFAEANYGDGDAWFPSLGLTDFEFEEKSVILPPMELPSAILHRVVPAEAAHEAERIRSEFTCWRAGTKKQRGCFGTQVFAYYNEADPTWFVLRTCSPSCASEFKGDGIMSLLRNERGHWRISSGGFSNNPRDVELMKPKIEQAEMLRFKIW